MLLVLAVSGCGSVPAVVQKCPPLPMLPESLARHPQNGDLIPNEMKPYLSPPSGARKSQTGQ